MSSALLPRMKQTPAGATELAHLAWAAGLAFVNSSGTVIQCGSTPPQDLTVSKTASPSFTRTYTWGISKSVDKSEIDTASSATFNYTVQVTHDGGIGSAWQVNGTIHVANPNNWEAVTADVADAVGFCHLRSAGASTALQEELSRRARDSTIRTAGACGSVK